MQQFDASGANASSIDIGEVLSGIWRRKFMIMSMLLVAVGLAVGYVFVSKPKYTATAKVLVENLETPYTKAQQQDRGDGRMDDRDVLSQVEVASSPDLARKVISGLSKTMQAQFTKLSSPGIFQKLMISTGFADDPANLSPQQRALARFNKNSTIFAVPKSKVIVLRYTAVQAETAAAVANGLAESYVQATRSAQSKTTDRAQDWLATQVDILRRKVVTSEVAVEEFRAKAGLHKGTNNTLNSQELSELNTQMILASAAKAEARARANSVRDLLAKTGSVEGAAAVLNSGLIQNLREQQVRLRRSRAELSATFLDNHPRIKAVKQELADLSRQIRAEALKIVKGLEQQAKIAATREASLRASLDDLKKKASSSGVDEVKLRALEREATANRQLLESFLARYSDAAARVKPESQPGFARVIVTAAVPSVPSFPKKGPIVGLAGIAGLTLGLGLAFLLEVMAAAGRMHRAQPVVQAPVAAVPEPAATSMPDAAPVTPQETLPALSQRAMSVAPQRPTPVAPAASGVSSLCDLPVSANNSVALNYAQSAVNDQASPFAGAMRAVASWLQSQRQTLGVKRVAMVALPGATLDCAAATVGLARCLSSQGTRVVVVEADEDTNSVDHVVPLQPTAGLAELLGGRASFADVIVRDQVSNVHFVRSGLTRRAGGSENVSMVLEALDHAYDLVLLNNGVTTFPAAKDHAGVTACHAAIVVAQSAHSAEAASLCGALSRAGLRAAQFIQVAGAQSSNVAMAVSNMAVGA